VYVDERDRVWLSDFGSNSILRFDPESEDFTYYRIPTDGASVRQLLGRPGEIWGAESSTDKLIRIRMHD
jgi:virginiamycin B lyase